MFSQKANGVVGANSRNDELFCVTRVFGSEVGRKRDGNYKEVGFWRIFNT